jgi:hypothetical protein
MLGVLTFDDDVCILHAKVYGPSQDFTVAVKKAAVGKSEEGGKARDKTCDSQTERRGEKGLVLSALVATSLPLPHALIP